MSAIRKAFSVSEIKVTISCPPSDENQVHETVEEAEIHLPGVAVQRVDSGAAGMLMVVHRQRRFGLPLGADRSSAPFERPRPPGCFSGSACVLSHPREC